MIDYKAKYNEARRVLQDWAGKGGQDLCFWHPDILGKLAVILDVEVPEPALLRPKNERDFEQGCIRFRCNLVYPDRHKEGAD